MSTEKSIAGDNQMFWLDVLRIFACFSIVAVHIAVVFNVPGRIGEIMVEGSNGLGIFYILSGFLAFYSLDRYKYSKQRWIGKKLLRILPMYYFALIAFIIIYGFILNVVPEDPNKLKWISYFLGINTILKKGPFFWYNLGALSSMSVFLWFYVLAPVLKKIINNWEKSLVFLIFCYVMFRILQHTEYLTMFRAYYYFAIGITTYYAIFGKKEKATSLIFIFVIMVLILADGKGGLMYGLVTGLFIIVSYNMTIQNEMIKKIVSFLSKRTFAIYISHAAVLQVVSDVCNVFDVKCFCMVLLFSLIGIFVLYEGVDRGIAFLVKKKIS